MKKIQLALSALFCCLCILQINAQSMERSVLASAGKLQTGGGYSWSFTVGETLVQKFFASNTVATQGFQQGTSNSNDNELVIDPQSFTGGQLNCSNNWVPQPPVVLSSCGNFDISWDYTDIQGTACNGSFTITWNIWDECGNTATWVQNYIHHDIEAPYPSEPIPAVQYFSCTDPEINMQPMFLDNCETGANTIVPGFVSEIDACGMHHYFTWEVTDPCGNTANYEAEVHYIDTQVPTVDPSTPELITTDCNDIGLQLPTFSDNCSDSELQVSEFVTWINANEKVTAYTVSDPCGNTITFTQTIITLEPTPPTLIFTPETMYVECGSDYEIPEPVFTNEIGGELYIWHNVNTGEGLCQHVQTHTWTATNECGLSTIATLDIIISDTQPPVANVGEQNEIQINCGDPLPAAPQFTDQCYANVSVTLTNEVVTANLVTRTYRANDPCGNDAIFVQTIFTGCCTAPNIIDTPETMYVECGENYTVPEPIFEDPNGGALDITYSLTTFPTNCGVNEVHSYTATNGCGMTATATVNVYITDTQDPFVNDGEQSNYIVECGESLPAAPGFSDACDTNLTIHLESETNENSTITRIWSAADDCGNNFSFTQTIQVSCCIAPVVSFLPESIQAECGDDVDIQEPLFTNSPDEVLNITYEVTTENNLCEDIEINTWTATNSCGLSVSATVNVFYADTQEPFAIGGQDSEFIVECGGTMPDAPQFDDVCDSALDIVIDSETNTNNTITRVWTATDDCGNTASFTQTVYVSCCNTPLVVEVADNMNVECGAEFVVQEPVFEDINGSQLVVTFSLNSLSNECGVIEVHSWTATNECGLSVTASTSVNITDSYSPYVSDAEFGVYTIECGDAMPDAPQFFDFCDTDLTVEMASETNENNIITRVWIANDDCGNTASFTQTIYVSCCTAPEVVNIPATQFIECGAAFDLPEPTFINTSDGELTLDHTSTITLQDCGYIETHNWIATNACGLSASASFDVVVEDNTTPVIDQQPINIELSCGEVIPAPVVVTATDNCDTNVEVTTEMETIYEDECGNITWQVNYEAIDDCGNSTSTSYLIIMEDTEEPVLSACPDNLVLDCGASLPAVPAITAMDACAGEIDVLFEEFELGNSLGENVESQCALLTPVRPANNPCGYPVNWALALFGLPKSHRYYYLSEGTFTEMSDGSLLVEATIHNAYTPTNGWQVSFRFDHGMTWEQWSAQQTPHSFKADCGSIAANHTDWMYYLMMNMTGAEMIGIGGYAGSSLSTLHAPSNGYFGFQLGDGANNYNAVDNGFGGWFRYSGTFKINGVPYGTNNGNISGAGDLALELNCCESSTYIRQWTASDCSGNTATCVQEITVGSSANGINTQNMPDPNAVLETEMAVKVMKAEIDPNPASGVAILKFNTIINANTQVQIYSTTGELVATLMDSHSEEDIDFVIDFDTSVLPNGVYFCKITNGTETHTDRLIVTH